MATTEGLDPQLQAIVDRIIAESGGRVTISSGFRTNEQQTQLYNAYKSGTGNLAAKPGTSRHEHGLAVDFGGDLQLAGQLARKYGLVNSVQGEPWHYSLGGEEGAHTQRYGEYDLGDETSSNPQDVLANRLNSVMRIIGKDTAVSSPEYGDVMLDQNLVASPQMSFEEGQTEAATLSSNPTSAAQPKGQLQSYAAQKLQEEYGMSGDEVGALVTLWNRESGWDPNAQNQTSTAYGIAQFLNGTWAGVGVNKTSDPFQQIDAGLRYITQRYGSPRAALDFHSQNGYY